MYTLKNKYWFLALFLLLAGLLIALPVGNQSALQAQGTEIVSERVMVGAPCSGGSAGGFSCNKVDLMANLPLNTIGGGKGNDIWGWTDPQTGKEYAIMGRTTGSAFVDISNPSSPIYLGNLPSHTGSSTWRDMKVYEDHAFIGSEASGHGMQIFDLRQLRNVSNPPVTFSNTDHYNGYGNSHKMF